MFIPESIKPGSTGTALTIHSAGNIYMCSMYSVFCVSSILGIMRSEHEFSLKLLLFECAYCCLKRFWILDLHQNQEISFSFPNRPLWCEIHLILNFADNFKNFKWNELFKVSRLLCRAVAKMYAQLYKHTHMQFEHFLNKFCKFSNIDIFILFAKVDRRVSANFSVI